MKVSSFWASGGKRKLTQEWQQRDQELRHAHWKNTTPAENIPHDVYRKLSKKRRAAIEAAAYKST